MKRNRTKKKKYIIPEIVSDIRKQKELNSSVYFPFGKYKDQQVESVCNKDANYCLWFAHNIVTNSITVGRVKDVIIKNFMMSSKIHAACSYDSEAYADCFGSSIGEDNIPLSIYPDS